MFVTMVAIIRAENSQGVLVIANANPTHSEIKKPEQLGPVAPGKLPEAGLLWEILGTFRFLDTP